MSFLLHMFLDPTSNVCFFSIINISDFLPIFEYSYSSYSIFYDFLLISYFLSTSYDSPSFWSIFQSLRLKEPPGYVMWLGGWASFNISLYQAEQLTFLCFWIAKFGCRVSKCSKSRYFQIRFVGRIECILVFSPLIFFCVQMDLGMLKDW